MGQPACDCNGAGAGRSLLGTLRGRG